MGRLPRLAAMGGCRARRRSIDWEPIPGALPTARAGESGIWTVDRDWASRRADVDQIPTHKRGWEVQAQVAVKGSRDWTIAQTAIHRSSASLQPPPVPSALRLVPLHQAGPRTREAETTRLPPRKSSAAFAHGAPPGPRAQFPLRPIKCDRSTMRNSHAARRRGAIYNLNFFARRFQVCRVEGCGIRSSVTQCTSSPPRAARNRRPRPCQRQHVVEPVRRRRNPLRPHRGRPRDCVVALPGQLFYWRKTGSLLRITVDSTTVLCNHPKINQRYG
jgi:hypothetical protein